MARGDDAKGADRDGPVDAADVEETSSLDEISLPLKSAA
jgi:hypothetical protein